MKNSAESAWRKLSRATKIASLKFNEDHAAAVRIQEMAPSSYATAELADSAVLRSFKVYEVEVVGKFLRVLFEHIGE